MFGFIKRLFHQGPSREEILSVFTPDRPYWTGFEIADAINCPRGRIHVHLARLVDSGHLQRGRFWNRHGIQQARYWKTP